MKDPSHDSATVWNVQAWGKPDHLDEGSRSHYILYHVSHQTMRNFTPQDGQQHVLSSTSQDCPSVPLGRVHMDYGHHLWGDVTVSAAQAKMTNCTINSQLGTSTISITAYRSACFPALHCACTKLAVFILSTKMWHPNRFLTKILCRKSWQQRNNIKCEFH